jgi:hypothetical protein
MAEFCMGIRNKFFCKFYHGFNFLVGPISGCVIDINCLELDVKGRDEASVESYDVFSDLINFRMFFFFTDFKDRQGCLSSIVAGKSGFIDTRGGRFNVMIRSIVRVNNILLHFFL